MVGLERRFGYVQQTLGLGRNIGSYRNRDGRITVVAVQHDTGVDGDDIAFTKDSLLGGDSVDHLLVDRSAQHAGVPAISLERGSGAKLSHLAFRRVFQIERGHAGLDESPHMLEHLTNHRSAAPHFFNFLRRLNHDGHRPVLLSLPNLGSESRHRGHDASHYFTRRLFAVHFNEPAAGAIMFHHRRRQRRIRAHPFMEN